MPPYTGTSYALSNLIGGVVGAQSPSGQLSRARRLAEEDQLEQTQALRTSLRDFNWDQPDAPEGALKLLASIDPTFNAPLLNLVDARQRKAIREEKQRTLAAETRGYADDGISNEEEARIRATETEFDLGPQQFRDPSESFYRRAAGRRAGAGDDPMLELTKAWLPMERFYIEQGAPPDEVEKLKLQFYQFGGFYQPTLASRTPQMSEDQVKRLEKRITTSDVVMDAVSVKHGKLIHGSKIAAALGKTPTATKPPPMYDSDGFLTPEWENTITDIATGKIAVDAETKRAVDEYVVAIGIGPVAGQKKGVAGF